MTSPQIKNSFSGIGEIDAAVSPSALVLKISAGKNAIRYFVLSRTHNQVLFHGDYTLHHVNSDMELAERLEKIFEKDEILQLSFGQIVFAVDEKYSLVPSQLSPLIQQQTQLLQHCGTVDLLFEVANEIQTGIKKLFPRAELVHLNSTFFKILPEEVQKSPEQIFVNVSKEHLDIIRFNTDGQLLLMNRYAYKAASDFIYFLLLCCEELHVDREQTTLVLIGEIDIESSIYSLCYRYFQTIRFLEQPEHIRFSKAFDEFPKHVHFNLYNL